MAFFPLSLLVAVIFPNIGGILGGVVTSKNIKSWYEHIKKPNWRPPNWAFGPVWTYLYCSMGYASYRVWLEFDAPSVMPVTELPVPLKLFLLQIFLNWIWTPIFFGMKNLLLALIEILMLDAAVIMTGLAFWNKDEVAGLLFVPYVIWLTLATTLTFFIWKDNPKWRNGTTNVDKRH
ncbi:hypothetical protein SK128_020451 [Halocaridina rubra]|uniref:Translocator protein n=1 Tax=Halocaridina rubra TaxID=373956 RepID=A0AAN8XKD7_HALRR